MTVTAPPRVVEIDLAALEENLRRLSPDVLDVRADAYGHGSERVLQTARRVLPNLRGVIVSRVELEAFDSRLLAGIDVFHDAPSASERGVVAGAAVYGLDPSVDSIPVMTVRAQVVLLKDIAAGEGVSYGATYRPESDTVVALVGIGYSQGIARRASNRCSVFVEGQQRSIAGAISMDLFSVDVGNLPVEPGNYVELFGRNSRLIDWAATTGIQPLALSSRVQSSVPRLEVRA